MKIRYVFSYEAFLGPSAYNAAIYSGIKPAFTLDEMLSFAINNINKYHILDVLDLIESDNIEFIYKRKEGHIFSEIMLYINGTLVKKTTTNEKNDLIWVNV